MRTLKGPSKKHSLATGEYQVVCFASDGKMHRGEKKRTSYADTLDGANGHKNS